LLQSTVPLNVLLFIFHYFPICLNLFKYHYILQIYLFICTNFSLTLSLQVYFIWKLLYMFRVVPLPIVRSANNCIYSIWYLSHRYCYLSLSWRSLELVWVCCSTLKPVPARSKHVEQSRNNGIINCPTQLHLVGHFCKICIMMHGSTNVKFKFYTHCILRIIKHISMPLFLDTSHIYCISISCAQSRIG
jgi:hypothetical protein